MPSKMIIPNTQQNLCAVLYVPTTQEVLRTPIIGWEVHDDRHVEPVALSLSGQEVGVLDTASNMVISTWGEHGPLPLEAWIERWKRYYEDHPPIPPNDELFDEVSDFLSQIMVDEDSASQEPS